jgi:hypothetical protein
VATTDMIVRAILTEQVSCVPSQDDFGVALVIAGVAA